MNKVKRRDLLKAEGARIATGVPGATTTVRAPDVKAQSPIE